MDKIIQANGFGVDNTELTQCNYFLVALTESGKVLLSLGDGNWSDVSPKVDNRTKDKYPTQRTQALI